MKYIDFLGYHLNGLEFVTYILIPTAMVSMILVYIISNLKLIQLSFESGCNTLDELDNTFKDKQSGIKIELGGLIKGINEISEIDEIKEIKEKV